MKKIFVINLGSTSTKVAYFENDKCILKENIKHKSEEIKEFKTIWEQQEYRKNIIDKFMKPSQSKVISSKRIGIKDGQKMYADDYDFDEMNDQIADLFGGDQ